MPRKKIEVQADESPELVAIFNPWQKAKQMAGSAEAKIESRLKQPPAKNRAAGRKEQWRWGRVAACLVILALVIGGGLAVYRYLNRPASPLSPELQSSLPFSPYVIPKDNPSYYTYDYRSANAEGQAKILSFIIITPDDNTVTLSEYAQPQQLGSQDIPQFLNNVIQQYAKVSTKSGTIYLGRATGAGNKQIGVLIEHGVLILMSPTKGMSSGQWQRLGDQLVRV